MFPSCSHTPLHHFPFVNDLIICTNHHSHYCDKIPHSHPFSGFVPALILTTTLAPKLHIQRIKNIIYGWRQHKYCCYIFLAGISLFYGIDFRLVCSRGIGGFIIQNLLSLFIARFCFVRRSIFIFLGSNRSRKWNNIIFIRSGNLLQS